MLRPGQLARLVAKAKGLTGLAYLHLAYRVGSLAGFALHQPGTNLVTLAQAALALARGAQSQAQLLTLTRAHRQLVELSAVLRPHTLVQLDHLALDGVNLMVHDWGGAIGLAWAVRHPARVRRLIILNTGAFHLPEDKSLPWQLWVVRNTPVGSFLVRGFNAFAGLAVHMACRSLRVGDCDMVLAGGATVTFPRVAGCFRQEARGMVPGDGVAVVLLKRLEDALADGDSIRAVIRGSGISNDGGARAGPRCRRRRLP